MIAYFCFLTDHEKYMLRCIELAKQGAGQVAPNPMVGAVLVHANRIIGEGYHQQYGKAHAEVNCINAVKEKDQHLLEQSILYVSLEPCAHVGKTPPCTELIIQKKIPHVVIGCVDAFAKVNGKGIQQLKDAGVQVTVGVLQKETLELNKRFFTFHHQQRPYIILKWAQSEDRKIGGIGENRTFISNTITNRLVHKWRSEETAILVGTATALQDNPLLTTRRWPGNNPIRLVIDNNLALPATAHLLDGTVPTIVFNQLRQEEANNINYHLLNKEESMLPQIIRTLYEQQIQSVLVEGGAKTLQSFIDADMWDEARVITNMDLRIGDGVAAPVLKNSSFLYAEKILSDRIEYFRNAKT